MISFCIFSFNLREKICLEENLNFFPPLSILQPIPLWFSDELRHMFDGYFRPVAGIIGTVIKHKKGRLFASQLCTVKRLLHEYDGLIVIPEISFMLPFESIPLSHLLRNCSWKNRGSRIALSTKVKYNRSLKSGIQFR